MNFQSSVKNRNKNEIYSIWFTSIKRFKIIKLHFITNYIKSQFM
jgi:hypothetical protein